jgi:NAD(P)H-hydrate epimerase
VRELDRLAIEEHGIGSIVLMENAGRACAEWAIRMLGDASSGPTLVLCGPGNNGGDGFVVARTLRNRGFEVELWFAAELASLDACAPDVRKNAALWRGVGGEIHEVAATEQVARAAARLPDAALVIDALFGTGLTRPLEAPWSDLVHAVNGASRSTLAVDVPSGLDANTGEVLGAAVRAGVTVSFVAMKPGFYLADGPAHVGRLVLAEIGVPAALVEEALRG